jgi:trans-2,3-dihydro-3-hydroxyanthranilate isomerase
VRAYVVADVFTDAPLQGNPVAVFTDAAGLSAELMQRAARSSTYQRPCLWSHGRRP